MPEFKDTEGRRWTVVVSVTSVKAVRSSLDIDLLEAIEGKILDDLLSDPVKLIDIIYLIVRDQRPDVTDEQFGASLGGDSLEDATKAFLEALVDFFPKGRREVFRKAVQKRNELEAKTMEVLAKRIDDPRAMQEYVKRLESVGISFTASEES